MSAAGWLRFELVGSVGSRAAVAGCVVGSGTRNSSATAPTTTTRVSTRNKAMAALSQMALKTRKPADHFACDQVRQTRGIWAMQSWALESL